MGQYSSYFLYQKFEQRGEQEAIPVYPNVYSIDADGTRERVVKIQDDPQCGYDPPVKPIYKWVNIPITQDYVCDDCPEYQTRWVRTDDTTCIGEPEPPKKKLISTYLTTYGVKTDEVECNDNPTLTSGETRHYNTITAIIGDCVTKIGDLAFGHFVVGQYALLRSVNSDVDGVCNIPNGVTAIGGGAFQFCSGLTNVIIPDSVTTIGAAAFDGCINITSITIGSGVTSINGIAFGSCRSLTGITINATTPPTLIGDDPLYDTNNCPIYVPCDYYADYVQFWSSYKSRLLPIEPCDKVKIKEGENIVFYDGNATLMKSEVSPYDYKSPYIGNCVITFEPSCFKGEQLTNITIPDSVIKINDYTFSGCTSLTSVTLGNSVASIDKGAFGQCDSLTSVNIPDSVTSIGNSAFGQCDSLTSVTIGSGVTSIGREAFCQCRRLTSITVNATTPPTLGTDALEYTGNNLKIYVPAQSVDTYKAAPGWSNWQSIIVGTETMYRWANMDASVDYYCEGTTKCYKQKKQVSFDNGVTWQDVTPIEYKEGGVAESKSIDCGYVPPTPPIVNKLVATYSDGTVNQVVCNGDEMLREYETRANRTGMTSVVIGDCVTNMNDSIFYGSISLTSITIPSSVTNISRYAFTYCTSLLSINIPDSVTNIGDSAFTYCTSLTSVTIGNSVVGIGDNAFIYCSGLTSINIPDSVTNIGRNAFRYCSGATSITIGSGVKAFGRYAFSQCKALTSITINAIAVPYAESGVFDTTNNCPIYVPAESVQAYKRYRPFTSYASRIQPIT